MKNSISIQSRNKIIRLSKYLNKFNKLKPWQSAIVRVLILLIVVGAVYGGAKIVKAVREKPVNLQTNSSTPGNSSGTLTVCTTVGGCDKSNPKANTPSTPTTQTPAPTSTPTPNSNNYSNNCQDETFNYATVQEDVTWLQTGQTMSLPGVNGTDRICNGIVTVLSRPTNAIDYIGTGNNLEPSSITPTQPNLEPYQNTTSATSSGLTESQAAQQCDNNLANGAGGDNPQSYYVTCMHQYGY